MTADQQELIKAREQLKTNPQAALRTFTDQTLWTDEKHHLLGRLYSVTAYFELERIEESKNCLDNAIKMLSSISFSDADNNLIKLYSILLNKIGLFFFQRKAYPSAIRALRAALKLARMLRLDEKHLLSFVSLNLAQCYLQTDQPSEAIQILEISRKIADNKSIQGMSSFLLYLLFKEKDLEQAGTFLEECINCWNENEEISQKLIERANTHKVLFHQKFFEQLFEQDINQAQEHLNKAINILYSLNKEEEVVKVYYEAANRLHKVDSPIAQEYYQAVYEKLSPDQDDLELREILEKSMIRLAFDALTKEQFSVAKKFFQEALKITIKNKERILSMLSHIQDIESTDQPSNQIKPPSSNKSERGKQQSHSEASSILPSIDKAVSPAEIKRKITEYYKNKGYKVTLETIVGSVQVDLMAQKKQKRILLMISTNRAEAAISILVLKGIPHQRGMKKAVYLIKGKPQEIQTDSNISIVNQLKALPS